MTIGWESLLWTAVSYSLSGAALFFCFRAYRRSMQRGFLLLAVALVVMPLLGHLARRPLRNWLHDRGWSVQEASLLDLAQISLEMTLLSAALILLARPLHRGRRT